MGFFTLARFQDCVNTTRSHESMDQKNTLPLPIEGNQFWGHVVSITFDANVSATE